MKRAPGSYQGLTAKQAELLSFIRWQAEAGRTPSFEEMGDAVDVVKSGVARLVTALEERGYIQRFHNRARAIVPTEGVPVPPPGSLQDATIRQLLDELSRRGLCVGEVRAA